MRYEKIGDDGYGYVGNIVKELMIKHVLSEEEVKEYRRKLEEENPIAYAEYCKFEKLVEEFL